MGRGWVSRLLPAAPNPCLLGGPPGGWATSYFWWLFPLWVDLAGGYSCLVLLWVLSWVFWKFPAKRLMQPLTQAVTAVHLVAFLGPGCSGPLLLHCPCPSGKPADRTRMTDASSLLSPGVTWA